VKQTGKGLGGLDLVLLCFCNCSGRVPLQLFEVLFGDTNGNDRESVMRKKVSESLKSFKLLPRSEECAQRILSINFGEGAGGAFFFYLLCKSVFIHLLFISSE
jgi:hypothetical protein